MGGHQFRRRRRSPPALGDVGALAMRSSSRSASTGSRDDGASAVTGVLTVVGEGPRGGERHTPTRCDDSRGAPAPDELHLRAAGHAGPPHTIRLRPAPHRARSTPIRSSILPRNHFVNWQRDPSATTSRVVFTEPVRELDITVDVVADMTSINPFDFFVRGSMPSASFAYPHHLRGDLDPYLRPVEGDPRRRRSGPGPLVEPGSSEMSFSTKAISACGSSTLVAIQPGRPPRRRHTVRLRTGVQTPDHTLSAALGSCRGSAWLLVSILRELRPRRPVRLRLLLVQLTADVTPVDRAG